jgi:hypothetical protein
VFEICKSFVSFCHCFEWKIVLAAAKVLINEQNAKKNGTFLAALAEKGDMRQCFCRTPDRSKNSKEGVLADATHDVSSSKCHTLASKVCDLIK